jgi:5-(carboxyamino)imidazole ribonucleotide mutase
LTRQFNIFKHFLSAIECPPATNQVKLTIFHWRVTGMIQIGIVMGSNSDWEVMQHAARQLHALGIGYETRIVSAHRTPDLLFEYAENAAPRGLLCIIAGAGGAAHLPGMLAAKTALPVLGVPVPSKYLRGMDSLYSIVQMPKGIPVATFAIGEAGASNAALFAAAMLAIHDFDLNDRLRAFRQHQTDAVLAMRLPEVDG